MRFPQPEALPHSNNVRDQVRTRLDPTPQSDKFKPTKASPDGGAIDEGTVKVNNTQRGERGDLQDETRVLAMRSWRPAIDKVDLQIHTTRRKRWVGVSIPNEDVGWPGVSRRVC